MNERTRVPDRQRDLNAYYGGESAWIWISSANYYLLVLLAAMAVFFAVWASLHDGYDETPWVIAALSAVTFVVTFVLFREIVLRRTRARALAARRLSRRLHETAYLRREQEPVGKITLQANEEMLREIRTKSEAAKVLGKLAEAHKEVFDLCEQYLERASAELNTARPGSPRIPALRKGSRSASSRHRFHMLKWAELNARSFTSGISSDSTLDDKIGSAAAARSAVERAMAVYPDESALTESLAILDVFLLTSRVRLSIEKAELAADIGDNDSAVGHYRDALDELQTSGGDLSEGETIRARIESEIGRLIKIVDV